MGTVTDELAAKVAAADLGVHAEPAPPIGASEGAAPAAPPAPDESQQWVEAALHFGAAARALVPERARPAWTDERLREFGAALARCAKHYGWTFGALLGHPLAGLAAAAFPLAWPIMEPYVLPALKGQGGPAPEAPPPQPSPPIQTVKPIGV